MADLIPLTRPDISDDAGSSLVRVRAAEIGQQPWNVDYDELGPVLQINKEIEDWRELLSGSSIFLPAILPAVMDRFLTKIPFEDKHQPNAENDYWADQFVELAATSGNRPFTNSERNDEEIKREWINDVVEGFSGRHRLADRLIRSLADES